MQVMDRKGYEPCSNQSHSKTQFHNIPELPEISSTFIRSCSDESELQALVPKTIADVIVQRKLYGFSEAALECQRPGSC